MAPITVNKIVIQGVKGILKPIELSLGKASKPCSLAIFAPNACGKSGIADALEYFFDEKGEIQHLGIRSDSETGGKAAIPHIHAIKSKFNPEITMIFQGGKFSSPLKITRKVKTGTKDSRQEEISNIVDSARAVRILRQHDLRSFVVDYEPARKYNEVSRWVGLEVLDTLRKQIQKAQSDFIEKNKDDALRERLVDITKRTGNKVTNYVEKNILDWINDFLFSGIGISRKLKSLADTKAVFEELDKLQKEEDEKVGVNAFQDILKIVPSVKDEKGNIVSVKKFTFEQNIDLLKKALNELDEAKSRAKEAVFKELWDIGLPLIEEKELFKCPLCETEWENTKYKSRPALVKVLKLNLETLKAVSEAEDKVSEARNETTQALENDKRLLLKISERSKTASIKLDPEKEKNFSDILDNLSISIGGKKCKTAKEVPISKMWFSKHETVLAQILDRVRKADHEIQLRDKESPDRKRFHDAKKTISEIIESRRRYQELQALQKEFENVGDALSKIRDTIIDAIKNQMENVLKLLKNDISTTYKKINRSGVAPEIHIEIPPEKSGSLYLRISFYDLEDPVPPGGYLSESYVNTLGIAVFLAAVKNFNSGFPFIVLDDIVSSYDADHRSYIVDVLAEDFKDYQIVLTTHDHLFYRHLRQRLQNKNWRFKQIKDWNIEHGPLFHDEATDDQEIESMFKDKTNYQAAGNAVRVFMEEWFDHICPKLGVHTPHKSGVHHYSRTLHDFWTPFVNQVISFGPAIKEWLVKQQCYDRLKSHPLINYYSHYQSNPYEWGTMEDVKYVWENFKEFRKLFRCHKCDGKLSYNISEDKKPYCKKCGEWPKY